ncbi:hypothetical protein OSB04_031941 [Centaurea solstitialis]|uniref:CCHC-type domain-containing protein n=1 Tax=Centaurea solstitialis TaxID=347529 RepID=A0AA38SI01_9ASTR|nr:hypothetical protein OSB04_031941 [Centaurea solstitialis]
MPQTQARTERYHASRALNACKMAKGTSTIAELHSMLKTAELSMGTKTKDVLVVTNGGVKKKRRHGNTSKGKGQIMATLSAPRVNNNGKGKSKGKKVKSNIAMTKIQYFKCHEVGHWRHNCPKHYEAGRNHSSTQQLRNETSFQFFHSKFVRDNLSWWEPDRALKSLFEIYHVLRVSLIRDHSKNPTPVNQEAEGEEAQQVEEALEAQKEAEVEVAQPRQPEIGTRPAKSLSSTEASHTDATRPMPSSQVVGSQPTQMHTQAIHSTTSQQVVVSSEHGALPPIPSFTRLESIGVETRVAHPQHSPSFMTHGVLEPLGTHLATSTRSPAALDAATVVSVGQGSTFAGLSLSTGFAHEPVLTLSGLEPRDSDGILKAVQSRLEAIEKADAAKDRRLAAIERALAVKEQEDQARRAEIEALRKADEDRQKELDEAKRFIKGKFQEGERPSFGDSSRSPTPVLRLQPPPLAEEIPGFVSEAEHQIVIAQLTTQNDALQRQVDQYKQLVTTRDMQLEIALRRVRELEATCRSQAQPSKRGHDDPDDTANPHEGGDRLRGLALTSPPAPEPPPMIHRPTRPLQHISP